MGLLQNQVFVVKEMFYYHPCSMFCTGRKLFSWVK